MGTVLKKKWLYFCLLAENVKKCVKIHLEKNLISLKRAIRILDRLNTVLGIQYRK